MIDTNVTLGRWPFRRLPDDDPARLAARLRARGVQRAFAGSFDALLHRDLGSVNAALAETCRTVAPDLFMPFGAIDPNAPGWREDLRVCHERHRMTGIRLHPNYHRYRFDLPALAELFAAARTRGLLVQIAMTMEDERQQLPLMPVLRTEAAGFAPPAGLRILMTNVHRVPIARELARASRDVWFDLAMIEGLGGAETLAAAVGEDRVVFGSHAPFYYWEAADLKLREAALAPATLGRIRDGNARDLGTLRPA